MSRNFNVTMYLVTLSFCLAVTDFCHSAEPSLDQAKRLMNEGYLTTARNTLTDIIANNPNTPQAMNAQIELLVSYLYEKNPTGTDAAIDTLITDYADVNGFTDALLAAAENCIWWKGKFNYPHAQKLYTEIANRFPGTPAAEKADIYAYTIANILQPVVNGDYAAAQSATDRLIDDYNDNPYLPEALLRIARRYIGRRNLPKAKPVYEKIIALFPNTPQARRAHFAIIRDSIIMDLYNHQTIDAPAIHLLKQRICCMRVSSTITISRTTI